jgi:hypothetical protein
MRSNRWLVSLALVFGLLLRIEAADAQEGAASLHFKISVSGGLSPIVSGSADIPDGTQLFIVLAGPWLPDGEQRVALGLSGCGEPCSVASGLGPKDQIGVIARVKNGRFSAGPFSMNGKPLRPAPVSYFLMIDSWFEDPRDDLRKMPHDWLYRSTVRLTP